MLLPLVVCLDLIKKQLCIVLDLTKRYLTFAQDVKYQERIKRMFVGLAPSKWEGYQVAQSGRADRLTTLILISTCNHIPSPQCQAGGKRENLRGKGAWKIKILNGNLSNLICTSCSVCIGRIIIWGLEVSNCVRSLDLECINLSL